MAEILHEAYAAKHTRRGRHAKLSIEEELFLSLKYLRQFIAAFTFAIGSSVQSILAPLVFADAIDVIVDGVMPHMH